MSHLGSWIRFARVPLLLAATALGCAEGAVAEPGSGAPIVERLERPVALSLAATAPTGGSELSIEATRGDAAPFAFDLAIERGEVGVQFVDGRLVLRELAIALVDVPLPATVVPDAGALLTGVEVELGFPAAAAPAVVEDGVVIAEPTAAIAIRWKMVRDGVTYDLAPIELTDVRLVVTIERREDGRAAIEIGGGQDGPLWSWFDHFELGDLRLSLVGATEPLAR
jgi:hypothetical protein